jgi:CID domain
MSDTASSLRSLLTRTDASAPAIQATAGAMMKHYDKSAGVAVVEWRNALHQARIDQHLPLLYVANEVLQNSKRNRGNKFLEAFSPILGQSLMFIAQKGGAANVERIRRTVKIWGDRHVFSLRYVNDLLKGLEPYRTGSGNGGGGSGPTTTTTGGGGINNNSVKNDFDTSSNPKFSPLAPPQPIPEESPPPQVTPASSSSTVSPSSRKKVIDIDHEMARINDDSSSDEEQEEEDNGGDPNSDHDDGGDLFGGNGDGIKLLDIHVDMDRAAAAQSSAPSPRSGGGTGSGANDKNRMGVKRRRSSMGSTSSAGGGGGGGGGSRRRTKIMSTSSLSELWNTVSGLEQSFDHSLAVLSEITHPDYANIDATQIADLVGDELLQSYKQVQHYEQRVLDQRRELHAIAQKRKGLELEAVRYLPWLETMLKQDEDDIQFCKTLQEQIQWVQHIHGPARAARDERLLQEAQHRQNQEDQVQRQREEEERKKFMESAMKKETEAKPGMVWNKALGEYVYLQTDESWRD